MIARAPPGSPRTPRRRSRRYLITGGALLLPLALCGSCGSDPAPPVPVHQMVATPFSRRITAEGNLEAVVSTPISPPQVAGGARVMKIAWLAPDGAEVATGDVVIRFDPTELEQQLERGQADLAAARLKLSKERIGARSAEAGRDTSATLAALELDRTARFQNKDTEIFSRNQIIESEIDSELSRARLEHAGDARSLEGRITRSKLAAIDVERRSAELQITQARAGLERLEVKAPKSGILVLKRDWRGNLPRVGEQVWPGRTIAKIPVLDQMEAEVFVLEVDGGGLSEGTPATVVVDARPGREIQAVVKRVDKLAKRRLHQLPVQYFAVTLELSETEPALMKPGQRVRATLILDKEEALMVPRQAVFEVEGAQVVYRRGQGGVFEPVEVELGAGTPGRVVVESGLTAGDQVALRDPTRREADDPAKPSGVAGEGAATP